MTTDELDKICQEVADKHGAKYRRFESGTRTGVLKRERMAKLQKAYTEAKEKDQVRTVTVMCPAEPVDIELLVRGGRANGKLD